MQKGGGVKERLKRIRRSTTFSGYYLTNVDEAYYRKECEVNRVPVIAVLPLLLAGSALAGVVTFDGSWGDHGFNVISEAPTGMEIVYSVTEMRVDDLVVDGERMNVITIPGVFLPNDEGAPNLPGTGRFIAIPQGATATVTIVDSRTEVYHDVNLAPAPPIPLETDDSPPTYVKDPSIYGRDAYYPAAPVRLSDPTKLRGVDVVILGITPFQYNPVTRELVVFKDLKVRVDFSGGKSHFGEDRLRSRWWEPVLQAHLVNYSTLPEIDFYDPARLQGEGYEYVIIVPDDPEFIAWGDTIKAWRKLQGISTEVFTVTELGGNTVQAIESFVDSAYNNWEVPPVAFLLLSDYENSGRGYGITTKKWEGYVASDNFYADVDGDDLPDLNFARVTAQNGTHLQNMLGKLLRYEREPTTNPGFYDHPLMACGWQTSRWFQLCTEVIRGFFVNVLGKDPIMAYNVYSGEPYPGCPWSSNQNTWMVVEYFSSQGLGYIPETNPYDYSWWDSGSTQGVIDAINNGAFIVQHRDHGSETGWGEPDFDKGDLVHLNNNMYPFVFSINCLTGKYDWSDECFAEAFHRMEHGALGLIAASEVSYSFVNDTYVFGYYDGLWPEFMPDYPSGDMVGYENLRPGFASVSGKYFLESSNWPYNPEDKEITYYLFHVHGDAFTTLYSEIPQDLTVLHDPSVLAGQNFFDVTANDSSVIALTVDGEIIGVGEGTGAPVRITIPPQIAGKTMLVTVTKANYFRYQASIPIVPPEGPYVVLWEYAIDDTAGGNGDGTIDFGETIALPTAVKNIGAETAYNVVGLLRTDDALVQVTDSVEAYGDVAPESIVWSSGKYDFTVSPDTPDKHSILFELYLKDANDSIWVNYLNLMVQAPVLVYSSCAVDDTVGGNGNGAADPGETVDLYVSIKDAGTGEASGISATLSTQDPLIDIQVANADFPGLESGEEGTSITPYTVVISPAYPQGTFVTFTLDITADGSYATTETFEVLVGQKPILLVDDDDGEGHEIYYIDALEANEYDFDLWSVSSEGTPTYDDMAPYKVVIWTTGDDYGSSLTSADQENLAAYLDDGGNLFLSSEDYLWDNGINWFGETYLHVGWYDSDEGIVEVAGVDGDPIGDSLLLPLTYPSDFSNFSDDILPDDYAVGVFWNTRYSPSSMGKDGPPRSKFLADQEYYGALRYEGSNFRTVFFAVPFDAISSTAPDPNNQKTVMARVLTWLGLPVSPVSLMLVPDGTTIPQGGELGLTAYLINKTAQHLTCTVLSEVQTPSGKLRPVFGPKEITLNPEQVIERHITHQVPLNAPIGTYTYYARAEDELGDVLDGDSFDFMVIPNVSKEENKHCF
jgi:hypothetical protein